MKKKNANLGQNVNFLMWQRTKYVVVLTELSMVILSSSIFPTFFFYLFITLSNKHLYAFFPPLSLQVPRI